MAEAIAALGVIASVAQLADYGFKLSIKLFSYSEAVSRADSAIASLSNANASDTFGASRSPVRQDWDTATQFEPNQRD